MDFSQISLLLVVAAVAAAVSRLLKQPLLVGYLFAGFVLALFGLAGEIEVFSGLGQIGVTLLLFLVGLEMNLKELPSIGKVALISGVGQIVFTSFFGFLLASAMGFGFLPSIYTAVALTFSSTIIIIKLLSEKKDLSSLYGRISVGFLLVQDFVAILILMFLAGIGEGTNTLRGFLLIGVKAVIVLAATWIVSKKLVTKLFDQLFAGSAELLFIGSIAWALGIASFIAGPVGFTLEIGGFLAGLALSNLPEHLQIAGRTRPLRDFFLTIFFVILGTKLLVSGVGEVIVPSLVFSVFVLVGNPLIVLAIMGAMGYKRRTSFMAGLTVAQISEFSLILMAMGVTLGQVEQQHMASVVIVAVITMTLSTYLIMWSDSVFSYLKKPLMIFERKVTKEGALAPQESISGHVLLIGADRTGGRLISLLKKRSEPFLVVDFNPKVFSMFTAERIPVLFGDISDPEIMELANTSAAKMVISTVANLRVNIFLLESVRRIKDHPPVVLIAETRAEAIKYYEAGASYVILPLVVTGDHLRHIFAIYGMGKKKISEMGKSHFRRLLE